jgi:serine protease inhibitor
MRGALIGGIAFAGDRGLQNRELVALRHKAVRLGFTLVESQASATHVHSVCAGLTLRGSFLRSKLTKNYYMAVGGGGANLRGNHMRAKMRLLLVTTVCGLGLFSLTGYAISSPSSQASQPKQNPSLKATAMTTMKIPIVSAYNKFGFDLFSQLLGQDQDQNIFASPLSVATVLAMTYNGAAGETEQAMARTLGLTGMSLAEVNQASAALFKDLQSSDPKVELDIANSLWARQGIEFTADFLERNRQFFGAAISTLDFSDPQCAATINRWVDTSTKGKIKQIVGQIAPDTVMFLVNAVYFKGKWQVEFDKKLTRDETFHLLDGNPKKVPMMWQSGRYPYYRGEKFQAVSLPYGEGHTSLYLFLPDQGTPLKDFFKQLNDQNWDGWLTRFHPMQGSIKLPRFKLEYDRHLNESLKALGMAVAFDRDRADFSRMRVERDLFIQQVKHKAVAEVNEEGTEASAATSVAIGITSAPISSPFAFVADRPFFMALRDEGTGMILFMGVVMEPK